MSLLFLILILYRLTDSYKISYYYIMSPESCDESDLAGLNLPLGDTVKITQFLHVRFHDDACTYFSGAVPVISHAIDDHGLRDVVFANFVILNQASPSALAKAHGLSARTVKRAVKRFEQNGRRAPFEKTPRPGRPLAIQDPETLERAAKMLLDGTSLRRTAHELGINYQTLRNYKAAGRLPGLQPDAARSAPTADPTPARLPELDDEIPDRSARGDSIADMPAETDPDEATEEAVAPAAAETDPEEAIAPAAAETDPEEGVAATAADETPDETVPTGPPRLW